MLQHFSDLTDPRVARTREHSLESILFIAICAVIAGEDDWVSIEEFARDKVDFFEQFIDLPNGIPSHDTFGHVFAALDTEAFAQGFTRWVQCVSESLALPHQGVVAIDGKTMRRTFDKANGKAAIHLVSAFVSGHRLVLGQLKVDNKSNEITAIPELLRRLTLTGCLVTLDARQVVRNRLRMTLRQRAPTTSWPSRAITAICIRMSLITSRMPTTPQSSLAIATKR